jgi:hypothetical protein
MKKHKSTSALPGCCLYVFNINPVFIFPCSSVVSVANIHVVLSRARGAPESNLNKECPAGAMARSQR